MRRKLIGVFIGFLLIPGVITSREVTLLDSLEIIVEHSRGEERIRILNLLSGEHLLINPVMARSFAMSALEEAERLDLTDDILSAYRNIGLSFLQVEQYDSAFCFFEASCDKAGSSGDDRLFSSALNGMGVCYTGSRLYDSALNYFDRSIIIAREADLVEQLAMNYLGKGFIYRKQGELSNAVEYYNMALDLLNTTSNEEVFLEVYKELGEFYLSAADIVNARETLLSALGMAESLRSEGRIAFLCYRLGYIHTRLGEESLALEYLKRSQTILGHHGEKRMLSEVLSNMGDVYRNMNHYAEALGYYKRAYEFRLESGTGKDITGFINNLGKAYALGGNYDEALVCYLKSLNISEQNNDLNVLTRTSLNIAELYALKKHYGNAVFYLENALARAEEIDDPGLIRDCHFEFSKVWKDQGNYKQALEHYEKYAELRESLIKRENDASLGDLKLNYEVLLREKEIKKLEIQRVKNEMDLQKQKNIRNYFIHITGVTILILAFLLVGLLNNRRKNKLLQVKNEQLEQANKKLVEYSEEMKKLNYAKDRLLSIISHDLRSPFNTLIGFSEILVKESERFSQQQLQTFYKGINETSKKSYELLQNLLDWTRLKTSAIPFHPMESSLADLAENSLGMLTGTAENKDISLEIDVSRELKVSVDRKMFETVLRNLISNAIKYTPNGGKVIIGAERTNGSTVVFVSDNGVGMSQEQTDKLFSVEEVVSTKGTDNEQGSGFGLIICREFIKKHGGELTVESKLGEGSTFRIILT